MTTIVTKNGSGAPLASDLVQGELAVDLTNKRLYTEDSGGTVIELGSNPTSLTTGTFTSTGIDDNATSTAITIDSSENTFFSSANTHAASVNVASFANTTTGQPVAIAFGAVADNGGAGNEGGIYFDAGADGSATDNQLQFNADHQSSVIPDMVITGAGNVGIGTTSPTFGLSVESNNGSGYAALFRASSSDPALTIQTTSSITQIQGLNSALSATNDIAMQLSGGNVGIGTASPSVPLEVNATTTGAILTLDKTTTATNSVEGALSIFTRTSGTAAAGLGSRINFITENSNGTVYETAFIDAFTSDSGAAQKDGVLAFSTANGLNNPTERMRINSSGDLLVGTTSATVSGAAGFGVLPAGNAAASPFVFSSSDASVDSQITWAAYSRGVSAYRFYVGYGGTIHATSTSITAISDASLKENVRDLDKGLATINALQPRRFDWKNGDGNDIMGFVAQEVEDVLPELVHDYKYSEEETKLGLKMGDMIPSMVKAIQELSAQVNELKAEVAALKGA